MPIDLNADLGVVEAVVAYDPNLPLLGLPAQIRPGDRVRFQLASLE